MPGWLPSALAALALASCAAARGPRLERVELSRPALGTRVRIALYAEDRARGELAAEAAFARIAEIEGRLSDYDPASELSLLGAASDAGAPTGAVAVSADLFEILARGLEMARATDGAFDPTVGPLTRLWRRARRQGELPSQEEIDRALASVGWRHLELDPRRRTARLLAQGMRLDLGGIAKGWAAAQALSVLAERGFPRALVAAGGDVVAGDLPPDRAGWRVEIASFDGEPREEPLVLELARAAVSTSGDTFQRLEAGGVRHSHVLEAHTGRASTARVGATVVAPDGATADALATALCAAGLERFDELLAASPRASARCVQVLEGEVRTRESPLFRQNVAFPPGHHSSERSP